MQMRTQLAVYKDKKLLYWEGTDASIFVLENIWFSFYTYYVNLLLGYF